MFIIIIKYTKNKYDNYDIVYMFIKYFNKVINLFLTFKYEILSIFYWKYVGIDYMIFKNNIEIVFMISTLLVGTGDTLVGCV